MAPVWRGYRPPKADAAGDCIGCSDTEALLLWRGAPVSTADFFRKTVLVRASAAVLFVARRRLEVKFPKLPILPRVASRSVSCKRQKTPVGAVLRDPPESRRGERRPERSDAVPLQTSAGLSLYEMPDQELRAIPVQRERRAATARIAEPAIRTRDRAESPEHQGGPDRRLRGAATGPSVRLAAIPRRRSILTHECIGAWWAGVHNCDRPVRSCRRPSRLRWRAPDGLRARRSRGTWGPPAPPHPIYRIEDSSS
jgi:hypothetical protein